jgi:hypothetical protein
MALEAILATGTFGRARTVVAQGAAAPACANRAQLTPPDIHRNLPPSSWLAGGRDGERLDWLERKAKTSTVYMDGRHPWNLTGNPRLHNLRGPTLRAAIDAAMTGGEHGNNNGGTSNA